MAEPPPEPHKTFSQWLAGKHLWNRKKWRWISQAVIFIAALAYLITNITTVGEALVKSTRWVTKQINAEKDAEKAEAEAKQQAMEAEADRLGKLEAGNTLSSFRNTLDGDEPEKSFDAPGNLEREIYVREYDYVQAWVDDKKNVAAFSVTVRTNDFHPKFPFGPNEIVLGKSSIADAFGNRLNEPPMALGGMCGKTPYYYEAFGGAGAVNYQTMAFGIAYVGAATNEDIWHSLCTEEGGDLGEAGQRLADCKIFDFDPNDSESVPCFADSPAGKRFRQDAIINVFAVTKPDGELPEEEFPQASLAPNPGEVPDRG